MRLAKAAGAAAFAVLLAGCASISSNRHDFVIVEGEVGHGDWDCGPVARNSGGSFGVCDMPLNVHRVVFGAHAIGTITARFFIDQSDQSFDANELVVGPHLRVGQRRAAAILWQSDSGPSSFMLLEFPGRWCVPDWMKTDFNISAEETVRLRRAGYPFCSQAQNE